MAVPAGRGLIMLPDSALLNDDRLHNLMVDAELDVIVATSPENVTYMSGFWALPQWIRRGPQAYVLWPGPGQGEPEIITSSATLDLVADQKIWVSNIRRFGSFHLDRDPDAALDPTTQRLVDLMGTPDNADGLAALVTGISEAGLVSARIGIDEIGLLPGQMEKLREHLPEAKFTAAAALLRKVRAIKTPEEIARLARIANITECSIGAVLEIARDGVSEIELARAFHARTVADDAVPVLGCIGFGERSALPNVQPSERRLTRGDVIRFDVGGRYGHYRADIARIATFGEPRGDVRRYHHALLKGVERACELIRPGVPVSSIFEAAVETVRREGIDHYRRSHVGHGIGIDGYDAPALTATSDEVLEAGMVLCVETPYYELGRWGLQVEDMLVVRSDGAERLMATSGDLIEVEP